MKINIIQNHNSCCSGKKNTAPTHKPAFGGKVERELFEAIVEKNLKKPSVSLENLKEAFLEVVSSFNANGYYSRQTKTPAPIKQSFRLPHGHFSVALFPKEKTILARDVLSTKGKTGENVTMYIIEDNSVIKKVMKGYKDARGKNIPASLGNQTLILDKAKRIFT